MANDLTERLYGWLEESGRALEMRTARTLARTDGCRIALPSPAYEDVVTGKQREGDVMALFGGPRPGRKVSLAYQLAVECKSGRDKPWIAFYDERRFPHPVKLSDWWLPSGSDWTTALREEVVGKFEWENELFTDRLASHTVSALGKDSVNVAQDAVMQAFSFASALAKRGAMQIAGDDAEAVLGAVMPVVVTQAPLFACELDEDANPVLSAVDRFDVQVSVKGWARRRVYVLSESGLAKFARALGRGLARV